MDPVDVFISYRRGTSTPYAGRMRDALADRFGEGHVFMDMDSILPGTEWDEAIRESVKRCRVLLALIGRGWVTVHDAENRRRLQDPGDFVRLEIESALSAGVAVIPILLHGTRMPKPEQLPGLLKDLARRQALTIRDESWRSDVARLLEAVQRLGSAPVPTFAVDVPSVSAAPSATDLVDAESTSEESAEPEPAAAVASPAVRTGPQEPYLAALGRRLSEAGYESVGPSGCPGATLVFVKRIGVGQQSFGFAARAIKERSAKALLGAYTGEHLEVAVVVGEFPSLSNLELTGFVEQAKTCAESLLHRKGTRLKGAYFAIPVAVTRNAAESVVEAAAAKPTLETKGASALPVVVDLDSGAMHYFRERTLRWAMLSSIQHIPDTLLSVSE